MIGWKYSNTIPRSLGESGLYLHKYVNMYHIIRNVFKLNAKKTDGVKHKKHPIKTTTTYL